MGKRDDASERPRHFTLTSEQRVAWLRLIRTDNVGPATFRDLINHCGSAANALEMLPDLTRRGGRTAYLNTPTIAQAEDELARIEALGARLIGIGEASYPPLLRQIDHAPPLVTVKGNPAVFERTAIAIVGSRNASMAGLTLARRFASDLGGRGLTIVSGLARGIDRAAHEASLETGTVAVLAGGLDRPYPAENEALLRSIEEDGTGASITEMPLGWEPRARDFPRRNRIIAGMSLGLLVVEAAMRSGSLVSARLAGEMGRTVFAVPGSPLEPRAHGTNTLIRNGANLAASADDILDALQPLDGSGVATVNRANPASSLSEPDAPPSLPPGDDERTRFVSLIGPVPVHMDALIAEAGISAAQAALITMELELAGQIERHSGGLVSKRVAFP